MRNGRSIVNSATKTNDRRRQKKKKKSLNGKSVSCAGVVHEKNIPRKATTFEMEKKFSADVRKLHPKAARFSLQTTLIAESRPVTPHDRKNINHSVIYYLSVYNIFARVTNKLRGKKKN